MTPELSWSVRVGAYMRTYSLEQQEICRLKFKFLNFQGPVQLHDPTVALMVLLDFSKTEDKETPEYPEVPCYFGRVLGRGGMKEELKKYDLKRRLYLGPTSLDSSLAMIMANIAGARPGTLMLDPFVGTASILVALTHFGAKCFGYDIDIRVLKGHMHAGKQFAATATATTTSSSNNNISSSKHQVTDTFTEETGAVGECDTSIDNNYNSSSSNSVSVSVSMKGFKLKNIEGRTIFDNF
eukprot:gene36996-48279_t